MMIRERGLLFWAILYILCFTYGVIAPIGLL